MTWQTTGRLAAWESLALPGPGLGGHTLGGHLCMTPLSTLNPISGPTARTKDTHAITASKPRGLISPIR